MKASTLSSLQSDLSPCPFCGGRGILEPMPGTNKNWWRVMCTNHKCGGTTWPLSEPIDAADAWNRRING